MTLLRLLTYARPLLDALVRRETFATSGPRIRPRFYGGWSMPANICQSGNLAQAGYAHGVPMGGQLPPPQAEEAMPTFVVSAMADPGLPEQPGGLLQRLQIIKGWVDEQGAFHQEVHEVAGNPDNGATVDPLTCEVQGPGSTALCGLWKDSNFRSDQDAVYYARVVENPSCRWSQKLCLSIPIEERPDGCEAGQLPTTIQERAWTSPVWYLAERGGSATGQPIR